MQSNYDPERQESEDQPESQLLEVLDSWGFTDQLYDALARMVSLCSAYPHLSLSISSNYFIPKITPNIERVLSLWESGQGCDEDPSTKFLDLVVKLDESRLEISALEPL